MLSDGSPAHAHASSCRSLPLPQAMSLLQQALGLLGCQPQATARLACAPGAASPAVGAAATTATATGTAAPAPLVALLGPCHLLTARLAAQLLKATVDDGSAWGAALAVSHALLPAYELAYPPVWPNLALHLATLAKLEALLGRPQRALVAATRALDMLRLTHAGGGGSGSAASGGRGGAAAEGGSVVDQVARVRAEAVQEMHVMMAGGPGGGRAS